jgi:S-adenosylmethionine synthetase
MSDTPILSSALKQIERDLAQLPPHVTKQMVIAADDKGMTFGFAVRKTNGWEVSARVEQRWAQQRPEARVIVKKEW